MAFANNINRDMTAADARAVAGSESWMDIYPDDFDFEADPWEYLGDHRLFFDTDGVPHFAVGKNPFSGDLAQALRAGEKDGLLAKKAAEEINGTIRDTRSRYGEPKEWDHLVVGLTRAEASALGPDGVKEWARTVIQAMQEGPAGDGKRQMLVTPIHDDTDNVHLQFLLHRIPGKVLTRTKPDGSTETKYTVGASYELSRNSEAAGQMKQLNTALEAAGLPMISDFRMGAFSVSEPRAVSAEELARGAERVKDAGGITPPDLTTGPLPVQRERISPEMRHLDSMLADAVKRQKEAEAVATSAATAVAAAQHARAALEQYEAEVKAREAVEADLGATKDVLEATAAKLTETTEALTSARAEIDTLVDQVAAGAALAAELGEKIEETTAERNELATELGVTTAALDQERAGREADAKAAADREAALKAELDQVRATYEETAVELAKTSAELEAAQTAMETVKGELQAERDSFLDRARAWAEEHVRAPLTAQIDTLKAELVEARKSFAAEMAEAQRAFMSQLRELTASLRPQEAAPPARRQFPSWAEKSFDQLSKTERLAAQKSLDAQIKAGRVDKDMPLDTYVTGIHERWEKNNREEGNTPSQNGPKA